jgi:hypothetical protein
VLEQAKNVGRSKIEEEKLTQIETISFFKAGSLSTSSNQDCGGNFCRQADL